jgi:hypothetical protein
MDPMLVDFPVLSTRTLAFPRITVDPEKTSYEMSGFSWNVVFSTGSDSPVRIDSSTSN